MVAIMMVAISNVFGLKNYARDYQTFKRGLFPSYQPLGLEIGVVPGFKTFGFVVEKDIFIVYGKQITASAMISPKILDMESYTTKATVYIGRFFNRSTSPVLYTFVSGAYWKYPGMYFMTSNESTYGIKDEAYRAGPGAGVKWRKNIWKMPFDILAETGYEANLNKPRVVLSPIYFRLMVEIHL